MSSTDSKGAKAQPLDEELNRALGSVWARHTGQRPDSIDTEVKGDLIKCVIEEAEADAERSDDDAPLLTVSAQRGEAIASVRRATRRRVVGFVTKQNKQTGTWTQTFILEPTPTRF